MSKLSFIIINFHGLDDTVKCIDSILHHFNCNFEIILIDNSNDEVDYTNFLDIYNKNDSIYIYKALNKGFGNACNLGVSYANGDVLFFLNNDTIINKAVNLNKIFNLTLIENFIISPKVLNPNGSIQKNNAGFFNILSCLIFYLKFNEDFKNNKFVKQIARIMFSNNRTINLYTENDLNPSRNILPDWVSGCALIISKQNFLKANTFDENIFMYFEDQDLCFQHKKNGYLCKSINEVELTHFVSGSSERANLKMELIKLRSMIYYSEKNIKFGNVLKYIIFLISLPTSIFNSRIRYLLMNYFLR